MSGLSTDCKFAMLRADRGIGLDTFRSMAELAEQAIRSAHWDFKTEAEHVAWAEQQAERLRAHHDLPTDKADPMALLCHALRLAQRMPGTDGEDVRHTLRLLAQHLRRGHIAQESGAAHDSERLHAALTRIRAGIAGDRCDGESEYASGVNAACRNHLTFVDNVLASVGIPGRAVAAAQVAGGAA